MPLFDVPGWTVPSPLVGDASPRVSKKRKRPASHSSKLQSAEVNLDKLVKSLAGNSYAERGRTSSSKQAKKSGFLGGSKTSNKKQLKKSSRAADDLDEQKKTISRPKPLKPATIERDSLETLQPAKRIKTKHKDPMAGTVQRSPKGSTTGLTALQLDMKQSLDGARFR